MAALRDQGRNFTNIQGGAEPQFWGVRGHGQKHRNILFSPPYDFYSPMKVGGGGLKIVGDFHSGGHLTVNAR